MRFSTKSKGLNAVMGTALALVLVGALISPLPDERFRISLFLLLAFFFLSSDLLH